MRRRHLVPLMILSAACPAVFGEIAVGNHLVISGYALGSYQNSLDQPGERTERIELDAAKLMATAQVGPLLAVTSLWHQPRAPESVTVRDAYATLTRESLKVTAGKFQSLLGYESFELPELAQISYANGDFLAPIPGYHTGVKVDYSTCGFEAGFAAVDSLYSGPYYYRGDGEVRLNVGFEASLRYRMPKWILFAGLGLETRGNVISRHDQIVVADVWVSYDVGTTTLAAELTRKAGVFGDEGFNWLMLCNPRFGDHWSAAFRLSGEHVNEGPEFTKYTLGPGYRFTSAFTLRAEYSYYRYRHHPTGATQAHFTALQAVVQF